VETDGIAVRVTRLERDVEKLYTYEPAVVSNSVKGLHEDMAELKDELKGVRRALWGFGLSIAGGAVLFAFTAFQVWG